MGDELPIGWTREFSRSQAREYFFHAATRKSVWKREEIPTAATDKSVGDKRAPEEAAGSSQQVKKSKPDNTPKTSVAIIVPFRDQHAAQKRSQHLKKFIPHMEAFLAETPGIVNFHVFIVEQSEDGKKFNRGKLLNIGFKYACEFDTPHPFNSFIFHDVDLLPQEPVKKWYAKYPKYPIHIARCWGRYNNNPDYFGGIVAFSKEDFELIDGFPNLYAGWGGEDDELQKRVAASKLHIDAPPKNLGRGAIVDLENMDLKTKLGVLRKTDWKCNVKWEIRDEHNNLRPKRKELPWWGVKSLEYKLLSKSSLGEHSTKLLVDILPNLNADGTEHWSNNKTDWK
uniref:WW domain-containing protein n=1 Tax=Mucochytrium quahogii TaxID=96639 RepID=A0A7S2R9Z3_9STRA|mmetsp:Transcript_6704/g.10591  ORF Transcript_6704/g.10591 Transcript_6704/m.10591 type:complete len:340 (+) Transcript_6704:220-1239(+)|eukprot:CAMPEP_0203797094 /NCGR_PEP_ID=MMETSP0100_2-20121128/8410_1 /ASSEMBLY_ACC=CAM_ASM_000210 /TAXON_ID=96639 /ORGANISM=" , Strain NY0313808BC1" /LENGTH=339 /DNA_ID=CAMNT_0050702307 /DNA_START=120 /DNA_END=1139 /DNA_ORIENTATION=-